MTITTVRSRDRVRVRVGGRGWDEVWILSGNVKERCFSVIVVQGGVNFGEVNRTGGG